MDDEYTYPCDIESNLIIAGLGKEGYLYLGGRNQKRTDKDVQDDVYVKLHISNKCYIAKSYRKSIHDITGIHRILNIGDKIHEELMRSPTHSPNRILPSLAMYRDLNDIFEGDYDSIDTLLL